MAGANSHGQLGLGTQSEQCLIPQEVDLSSCSIKAENIKKIVGGAGHTLILCEDGHVYSCGWNNKGQLGNGGENEVLLKFQKLHEILENEIVTDIACGWDSSAALTREGKLFVWGSNSFGQLGINPSLLKYSNKPIQVKFGKSVKRISMGLRHTILITQDNEVLASGAGSKGQLGMNSNSIDSFTLVAGLSDASDISCGQHHTVVVTKEGDIYVFGSNNYGQLGLNNKMVPSVSTPIKLKDVYFDSPVELHCGWTHTTLLNDGSIFTWGRDTYGQIGRKNSVSWKPARIEHLSSVQQLSVGSQHSVALTDNGAVLCWGWNEHGNCGNGSVEDVLFPQAIPIPQCSRGILVGTGAGHSFAVIKKEC